MLTFDTFVGQKDIVKQIDISAQSSKEAGRAMENLLLLGGPGLGKSLCANLIAGKMGYKLVSLNPLLLKNVDSFYKFLMRMENNTVLFIDEIHECSLECSEILYPLMQDHCIQYVVNNQPFTIQFKNITVVGATTEMSLLPKPLLDRFTYKFHFSLYTIDELVQVIKSYCNEISFVELANNEEALREVAGRSKGTPRIALGLTKLVRDDYNYYKDINVERVCSRNKILPLGIDAVDYKILSVLSRFKDAVGLSALSSFVGEETSTLMGREKYLSALGFVDRTLRGRKITDKGLEWVKANPMAVNF